MAGTLEGGRQAARTNKLRHGANFYNNIGKAGGQKSQGGGFASRYIDKDGLTGRERARIAGQKGGKNSWRKRNRNG